MFLSRFLFPATPLFFPGTGYSYSNSFGERIVSKGDWLLYENRQTSKLKTMVL